MMILIQMSSLDDLFWALSRIISFKIVAQTVDVSWADCGTRRFLIRENGSSVFFGENSITSSFSEYPLLDFWAEKSNLKGISCID